ncbi:class I SAM-dependent methyltransferase [Salinisphaera sp. T31B1]|uniref:class I SAM-dependent methyltransferase n=1 Tax=Salinisphaera sp. T31B1 TaxID=727963 RepID=UPI00333F26D4
MTSNDDNNGTVGNPRVGLTGYVTASAWARYGFAESGRFDSRRGRLLFGLLRFGCRAIAPISPPAGAFARSLYWRHRWFSDWVMKYRPHLAIEIGAGLSGRGLAHARTHPTCRWVDYDLPHMTDARRTRLHGLSLPANYDLRSADLLGPAIGAELSPPDPLGATCVLLEGVIDYLDPSEKQRALSRIATLLGRLGGGRLLMDIHPAARLAAFGTGAQLMLAGLRGISGRDLAGQLFVDVPEALSILGDCGFEHATQVDDVRLDGADRAPPAAHRAFCLVEATVAARTDAR